ncbi:MAG: DUF368 domain-containing protein [Ruminococcaceae bacterium]|nr:DUF368 domain-containing protein [Oscillospiraceae bacterium]
MKDLARAVGGGIAVGIANVIPGVSGGTMMAIMNIFDRTMNAISDVTKKENDHRRKDILFLLEVVLGAGIGILGFSFLLEKLFAVIPMPTVFWFVGLVALSVPVFLKSQMKDVKFHATAFIIGAAIVAALTVAKVIWFPEEAPQIDPVTGAEIKIAYDLPAFSIGNSLLLTLAGTVSGFAMLLPGISGSLVLMILGLYEFVWFNYVNNAKLLFKEFSLDTVIKFIPAGFFAIGIVLGIVLSAKFTAFAMKKNARFTLSALLGLVSASAVSIIFVNMQKMTADVWMIVGSVVAFAIGGAIVWLLGKVTAD